MTAHDYPNGPALGKTDTSAEAGVSMRTVTGRVRRTVYLAIAEIGARGLTTEEIAVRTGMEPSTVQPRTTELKVLGLIRDSGLRRANRNGKRAIVWIVAMREERHG